MFEFCSSIYVKYPSLFMFMTKDGQNINWSGSFSGLLFCRAAPSGLSPESEWEKTASE